MKHATPQTLAAIADLLAELRRFGKLVERTPGSFYFKSKAFLHFHEDPSGIFADVKLDLASFTRMRVASGPEKAALVAQVKKCMTASSGAERGAE